MLYLKNDNRIRKKNQKLKKIMKMEINKKVKSNKIKIDKIMIKILELIKNQKK